MDSRKALLPVSKAAASSLFGDMPEPKQSHGTSPVAAARPAQESKKRSDPGSAEDTKETEPSDSKKPRGPVDTATVVKKIVGALGSAKGPKLELAVKLFKEFLDNTLMCDVVEGGAHDGSPPTVADVVFEQLKAAVHPIEAKCARGERLDALVVAFKALCANAGEDWAMFSPDHRPYLMLWHLATVVHRELITDDTYQFSSAVARLKPVVVGLSTPEDGSSLSTETAAVVFLLMGTMYEHYKFAWARTPIEDVFREASQRRLLFSKAKRDVLDTWQSTITARKSSLTAVTSKAPVVAGGGSFHPLRNTTK